MGALLTYFTSQQLLPLYPALLLVILSIIFFEVKENKKTALILLLLGGLGVRVFMALLDPYLNMWDEQFHALVAKNMISHPFKPMLYVDPVFPVDISNWSGNHVWLHKQPLFLWQIALSIKLFGLNEFAVRLPSILLSTVIIYFIFRIGKITISEKAGYYGALIYAMGTFSLELVAGNMRLEHNDTAFICYVTASIWAWVEFNISQKRRWLILIGLFSGGAILIKWLTGFLVYSGWGLTILFNKDKRKRIIHYIYLLISLGITVLVFLPWQIYIMWRFPREAACEYSHNTKHILEAIGPHKGNFWYYFEITALQYGPFFQFLIPVGLFLLFKFLKKPDFKIVFATYIIALYCFFSFVETKMPAFTYAGCIVVFLSLGIFIEKFFQIIILNRKVVKKRILLVLFPIIILSVLATLSLDIEKIQLNHTFWKQSEFDYRGIRIRDTEIIKTLPDILPPGDYVIMNCRQLEHVLVMFYTDYTAYDFMLSYDNYKVLKDKGVKMAVFDNNNLPDYLLNDPEVFKIKSAIW